MFIFIFVHSKRKIIYNFFFPSEYSLPALQLVLEKELPLSTVEGPVKEKVCIFSWRFKNGETGKNDPTDN